MKIQHKETILVELKNVDSKESNYVDIFIIPLSIILISTGISFILSKFVLNKKEKMDINKLKEELINLKDRKKIEEEKIKSEVEKLNQEIGNLKKHYQPFVFDSLNKIGNELLPRKVKILENLVRVRYVLFNFENIYYEGRPLVEDESEYFATIARNINREMLDDFRRNIQRESYYFNSGIISKINELSGEIVTLYNYDLHQISLRNQDSHPQSEDCIKRINNLFEESIELIRQDLQLDNHYIQDFLRYYNKIE